MANSQKIPLFPLHTVLFPGMVLPLHIFEDRYKLMIYRCVTENLPFGVVMIREGHEARPGATIFEIGTTAHITKIDPLGDGRMNIATLGFNRFRIQELGTDEPYMTAVVEDFPLGNLQSEAVRPEARRIGPLLLNYLDIIASVADIEVDLEKLPDDATTLAFLAAIVLRVPMEDKQELLSIPTLPEMLWRVRKLLGRETSILRHIVNGAPGWIQNSQPFTPN
ncbi:MAG: hypothetical protein HC915_11250 [Anaerolineae bacterium]|nr:hypothetical protein [Anaerolineae bacterium]